MALLQEFAKEDDILLQHLQAPIAKNVTYLRPCSQNEMIDVIGRHIIQKSILEEVKEAGVHGIMVDEVTSNNDEVVSICMRFVDKSDNIREEFIDFVEVNRITGDAISKAIVNFYERNGLKIEDLRSQCYDGASNMSSEKKGVAGNISRLTSAPYMHCNSHILSLSIASSCKDTLISHVIATMKSICFFWIFS